jgi:hypothetical protein
MLIYDSWAGKKYGPLANSFSAAPKSEPARTTTCARTLKLEHGKVSKKQSHRGSSITSLHVLGSRQVDELYDGLVRKMP